MVKHMILVAEDLMFSSRNLQVQQGRILIGSPGEQDPVYADNPEQDYNFIIQYYLHCGVYTTYARG